MQPWWESGSPCGSTARGGRDGDGDGDEKEVAAVSILFMCCCCCIDAVVASLSEIQLL